MNSYIYIYASLSPVGFVWQSGTLKSYNVHYFPHKQLPFVGTPPFSDTSTNHISGCIPLNKFEIMFNGNGWNPSAFHIGEDEHPNVPPISGFMRGTGFDPYPNPNSSSFNGCKHLLRRYLNSQKMSQTLSKTVPGSIEAMYHQ